MSYLTRDLIQLENSVCSADSFHSGAEVLFLGKVRNHSHGKKVLFLEYEAYEAMAEKQIENLIAKARERWKIDSLRVLHRLGKVALGEAAVLIQVQSAHRDEAYRASRHLIDSIKHQVPIWKKEYFEDGTCVWGRCEHPPSTDASEVSLAAAVPDEIASNEENSSSC